jgi:hypothetical protein
MTTAGFLDACVLVPIRLASLLLSLADRGLFTPLWTEQILEETSRTLHHKLGMSQGAAQRRIGHMRAAFPEAGVTGYEGWISSVTCDPKDRHVLAAAVAGGAELLITANLKDFPDSSVDPFDIVAVHPDVFLLDLWRENRTEVEAVVLFEVMRRTNPPLTPTELLAGLAALVPNFANLVHESLGRDESISAEPLLVAADPVAAHQAMFDTDTLDLTRPVQVGTLWWTALLGLPADRDVLEALSLHPRAFGDYQWAVDKLADRSLASGVRYAVDAPDRIAYMQFVPEVAQTSQVFGDYLMSGVILTLVKLDDGTWRVFGLGPHRPSATEVFTG